MDHDIALPPVEPIAPGAPAPSPQPSTLRKVFIGKDGLRAGWSLLIFIAILAALAFCVNLVVHRLYPTSAKSAQGVEQAMSKPGYLLAGEASQFLLILFVTWIMSKIERRPNSVYGLGDRRKLAHFFTGLAWGFAFLSLLILTLWKTGLLVFDGRLLFGSDILLYGVVWLLGFLMVGLFEEYATRGYVQYTLTRGLAGFYQWAFKTRHSTALALLDFGPRFFFPLRAQP